MSNVFTLVMAVKNIPATLRIRTEFHILTSVIENALNEVKYATNVDDAVVFVFYDDIHAVTLEKIADDYVYCYYDSHKEKFKINNELSFHRAAFLIARATVAEDLISSHLDNVETFTATVAK